jgi:hypothetical protein
MNIFIKTGVYATLLWGLTWNLSAQNYGFTSSGISPSSVQLRAGSKTIACENDVFFIGTNNKVYCIHWDGNTWTGGTLPLADAAPTVKLQTQLANNNKDIFFVGSADSKIYVLKYTTSGWIWAPTVASMNPVRDSTEIVYKNNHVFYVNTNNKICDIVYSSGAWSGGQQLVWTPTVDVKGNTQIIPTDIHVYFIGTTNKIYDVVWNGTTWQGGNWPLNNNAPTVRAGSNIENDFNHLFYVGNNGKIHELIYTSGAWSGGEIWIPNTMMTVRPDADLCYFDNHIYYVGTNNQICDLVWSQANGWSGGMQLIWPVAANVKAGTQITAVNKTVPIEGSLTGTQPCHHVFYIGTDSRIHFLVWDDGESTWPCYDCSASSTRKWYEGVLNTTAPYVNSNFTSIQNYGLRLYYANSSSRVQHITRTPKNQLSKSGWTLTRNDEFNSLATTQSLWDSEGPWSHGKCNSGVGDDTLWGALAYENYWNNFSVSSGIGRIETKVQPIEGLTWGWGTNPAHNNFYYSTCHYEYTNSLLCTGGINVGYNCPPSGQYCPCGGTPPDYCVLDKVDNTCSTYGPKYTEGVWGPTMVPPKFYQRYGWFEIRCKVPRGKHMWSAFWAVSKGYYPAEIDFFEIDGNGKLMLSNIYYENCIIEDTIHGKDYAGGDVNKTYAIGYRYYDDYYTYACEWTPTYIKWYLNNELIHTSTIDDPDFGELKMQKDEMWIMVNNYANNASAKCEPEIFPNYYDIDYVRIYSPSKLIYDISLRSHEENNNEPENLHTDIRISPNPNNGSFNINTNYNSESICIAEIYNAKGVISDRIEFIQSADIILSDKTPGMYFVKLILPDKTVVKKIIVY